jgi:hypothetical protein
MGNTCLLIYNKMKGRKLGLCNITVPKESRDLINIMSRMYIIWDTIYRGLNHYVSQYHILYSFIHKDLI